MAIEDRLEIERILNLIRNFGWELDKSESTDEKIVLQISKTRTITEGLAEGPD